VQPGGGEKWGSFTTLRTRNWTIGNDECIWLWGRIGPRGEQKAKQLDYRGKKDWSKGGVKGKLEWRKKIEMKKKGGRLKQSRAKKEKGGFGGGKRSITRTNTKGVEEKGTKKGMEKTGVRRGGGEVRPFFKQIRKDTGKDPA